MNRSVSGSGGQGTELDEHERYARIADIGRRTRAAGDRWHAGESLIIGVLSGGLLLGHHSRPDLAWRWFAAYALAGLLAVGVHVWRRKIHRVPPRWHAALWPASFALLLAAAIVLDSVIGPGVSPAVIAVAGAPALPGLAALAWTLRR